jgi:hypothetical protein
MLSETLDIETKIKTLNTVLIQQQDRRTVDQALRAANGDMSAALASLKGKLPDAALPKIALAHSLEVWSDDQASVVKALTNEQAVTNLRDAALRFNVEKLTALVDPHAVSENTPGVTLEEKKNYAITLHNQLFTAEPTAVL